MKVLLGLLVATVALLGVQSKLGARYDGFRVYKVQVKDEQQLKKFLKLGENLPVSYLDEIVGAGFGYDVVIDPAHHTQLETQLRHIDVKFKCVIEDLQTMLDEESKPIVFQGFNDKMEWDEYHSLYDIYVWLVELTSRFPNNVKSFVAGFSYEGRPIMATKISFKEDNKAIFIESNIRAIEWISSATTTCFIERLLTSSDPKMENLRENYDWVFVAVLDPDGLHYTHYVERLWHKNRKPSSFKNSTPVCYGTDLNRNFGFHWGVNPYKIFNMPCYQWYSGGKPNNQPEVLALQHLVDTFKDGYLKMYLAFHSYGNLVLLPYGHTNTEVPPNYDQMMRIAGSFADAARVKYGTDFACGSGGLLNYPDSGAAKDWAYGIKNIPFTATIKLRDNGTYGYFLPPSQIIEVCDEVTDGLIAMIDKATEEGLFA